MTLFWISAVVMTLITMVMLLRPLRRGAGDEITAARADFDITVYKDQLQEIERDMESGVLSDDQAEAARTEIERRMLTAAGDEDGLPASRGDRAPGWLIAVVLVVVPVGAVSMYLNLGQPTKGDNPFSARAPALEQQKEQRTAQIEKMILDIERRIKEEPNNPQNWARLGQANQMIERHSAAIVAYETLVKITDRHPDALTALGEAMFINAGEVVTIEALKLFKEAQASDPANPMPYYYLAAERETAGDLQGAITAYANLLRASPSDGEWVAEIRTRMEALGTDAGISMPEIKMLPPTQTAQTPNAPGPTQQQVQDAQSMTSDDQQAMIMTMVERLADKLKENPDDLTGWKRIAKAYQVLGDSDKQAEAEAQIKRLSGQ